MCSLCPTRRSPIKPASCDIGECSVAVVAVQDVLAPIGDEQVLEAVVVVVADAHADGPTDVVRPAFSVTSVNVPSRLFLYRRLVVSAGAVTRCR